MKSLAYKANTCLLILTLSFSVLATEKEIDERGSFDSRPAVDSSVNPRAINIVTPNDISTLSDGGWSSSGGGEFIYDRHNPWFMGDEPVKWCLNHGGNTNFSLAENDAKASIEYILRLYSEQLRFVQDTNINHVYYNEIIGDLMCPISFIDLEASSSRRDKVKGICKDLVRNKNENPPSSVLVKQKSESKSLMRISENFVFTSDCSKADLEFNLGNINDPKIQLLVQKKTERYFRFSSGISMRTSYDHDKKRGKGFIYIAADKGKYSYVGPRKRDSFWSLLYQSPEPDLFHPFDVVVAHEIGHVFGFRHINIKSNSYSLMNENTPTHWIANEISLLPDEFSELTGLFRNSHWNLFKKPILMAFDAGDGLSEFNFLFGPKLNELNNSTSFSTAPIPPGDRYHVRKNPPYDYNRGSSLSLSKFDQSTGEFKDKAYFEFRDERVCERYPVAQVSIAHYPENVSFNSFSPDKPLHIHKNLFELSDVLICGNLVSDSGEIYPFRLSLTYSGMSVLDIGTKKGEPVELKNYFSNVSSKNSIWKNSIVFPPMSRVFYLEKKFGENL